MDVSILQSKEAECEEDEIIVRERPLMPSGVPDVSSCSAGESGETLILVQNDFAEQVFRVFLGYSPKKMNES